MWAVKCVKFGVEGPDITTYFGPFGVTGDVAEFLGDNVFVDDPNFDTVQTVPLTKPPERPKIHPNQSQIQDYIDPIVTD